jgi:hypothetical protein
VTSFLFLKTEGHAYVFSNPLVGPYLLFGPNLTPTFHPATGEADTNISSISRYEIEPFCSFLSGLDRRVFVYLVSIIKAEEKKRGLGGFGGRGQGGCRIGESQAREHAGRERHGGTGQGDVSLDAPRQKDLWAAYPLPVPGSALVSRQVHWTESTAPALHRSLLGLSCSMCGAATHCYALGAAARSRRSNLRVDTGPRKWNSRYFRSAHTHSLHVSLFWAALHPGRSPGRRSDSLEYASHARIEQLQCDDVALSDACWHAPHLHRD